MHTFGQERNMSSALTCVYLRRLPFLDRPLTGARNVGPTLAHPPDTALPPPTVVDDPSDTRGDF